MESSIRIRDRCINWKCNAFLFFPVFFFFNFHFSGRTPPMVIITSKPATVSNQNPFTFGFDCREICSFECFVRQQGIIPAYSRCNSNRYTASKLQNEKTYVFYVRGTDDVGNQGNPDSYTWTVGKSILSVHSANSFLDLRLAMQLVFSLVLVTTKVGEGGWKGRRWKSNI